MGEFKRAKYFQKLIHIPKTGQICAKDNLARHLKKMQQMYGSVFNFAPLTFIMPNDYRQFINYYTKDGNENLMWICKPSDSCRGRGITIINKLDDLEFKQQSVLQEYI